MNRRCSIKKTVLSNFAIFTEKYMCTFFNKNADLQACNLIKNRLQHRCFLMSIVKFSRTPISKNICERLLLGFSFYISLNVFLHEQITGYKGGEEDIFSHKKQENHSITQLDEKKLFIQLFMMLFVISFFSLFLHYMSSSVCPT